jgi:phage terminase large subunit GpA-like protein
MRQFVWTMPYEPPDIEMTPLLAEQIELRTRNLKKGIVPADTVAVAVGVDTGKRSLHWTASAVLPSGGMHVIEYGVQPVRADEFGVTRGLVDALTKLAGYFDAGWRSESGGTVKPTQVWIDSGWYEHTDAVYQFCSQVNQTMGLRFGAEIYRPTKGYGEGQRAMTRYVAPQPKIKDVVYVGHELHISRVRRNGKILPNVLLVHINSDNWKSEVHQRLAMPKSDPIAITLYESASFAEHAEWSRHITAEKQIEKFVTGRGNVIVWERLDRNNHWLDATYSSVCAGDAILSLRTGKLKERKTLSDLAEGKK